MEEEKKMFEEIKPLIQDYIEYERQPIPDEWYDTRAAAQIERMQREYPEGREGYLLQALDDEEVGKTREQRKALIQELTEVRNTTKKEKQGIIYGKVQQFIDSNKEQMSREIEEKSKKLEELRKDRNRTLKAKIKAYKLRKTILDEVGKDSKIYKVADEEAKEAFEKYKTCSKEYNTIVEEVKQGQEKLEEFNKAYENVDFTNEVGIYNLLDMIGLQEELETDRMSDGQVYRNDQEIDDMEEIKKMQEEATKQQLREKLKTRFEEIEKGYEDLLSIDYLDEKQKLLEKDNVAKVLEDIEGMTLIDIYKEQLSSFDKNDSKRKEVEELIQKVESRTIELEKQGKDGRIDNIKVQENIMWRQYKAEQEAKRKQDEKAIKEILAREEEKSKKVKTKVDEKMAKENEQRKKRIFFINLEKGNEALITPAYKNLKENLIENYTMEQLEKAFEGKTIEDIYNFLEREAKGNQGQSQRGQSQRGQSQQGQSQRGQSQQGQGQQGQGQQGQSQQGQSQQGQGQQEPYKETTFIVNAKKSIISICVKGETEPYEVTHITSLIKEGKLIKKDFVRGTPNLFKSETKKVDPAILGALEKIAEEVPEVQKTMEQLQEEYVNGFVGGSNELGNIKYIFGSQEEIDYSDKTIKSLKKFAKKAEKMGLAEIEGLEETGYIAKFKNWLRGIKTKRIENKEMKQQHKKIEKAAERQAHFITNPTLSKDLPMGRVGLDEEKAEGMYIRSSKQEREEFINKMNSSDRQNISSNEQDILYAASKATVARAPEIQSSKIKGREIE